MSEFRKLNELKLSSEIFPVENGVVMHMASEEYVNRKITQAVRYRGSVTVLSCDEAHQDCIRLSAKTLISSFQTGDYYRFNNDFTISSTVYKSGDFLIFNQNTTSDICSHVKLSCVDLYNQVNDDVVLTDVDQTIGSTKTFTNNQILNVDVGDDEKYITNKKYVDSEISKVDGKITTVSGNLSNLSSQVSSLSDDVQENKQDIQDINSSIGVINGKISEMSSNISSLSDDVNDINEEILSINNTILSIQSDISEHTHGIQSLSDDVALMNSKISYISNDVSSLSDDVEEITVRISEIDQNVGKISGDVQDICVDMSKISGDLESLEGNVSDLSTNVVFKDGDQEISGTKTFKVNQILDVDVKLISSDSRNIPNINYLSGYCGDINRKLLDALGTTKITTSMSQQQILSALSSSSSPFFWYTNSSGEEVLSIRTASTINPNGILGQFTSFFPVNAGTCGDVAIRDNGSLVVRIADNNIQGKEIFNSPKAGVVRVANRSYNHGILLNQEGFLMLDKDCIISSCNGIYQDNCNLTGNIVNLSSNVSIYTISSFTNPIQFNFTNLNAQRVITFELLIKNPEGKPVSFNTTGKTFIDVGGDFKILSGNTLCTFRTFDRGSTILRNVQCNWS